MFKEPALLLLAAGLGAIDWKKPLVAVALLLLILRFRGKLFMLCWFGRGEEEKEEEELWSRGEGLTMTTMQLACRMQ